MADIGPKRIAEFIAPFRVRSTRAFAADRWDVRPGQRAAIERFATSQDVRVGRLRSRLEPAWRGVAEAHFRRGLGRSLARL